MLPLHGVHNLEESFDWHYPLECLLIAQKGFLRTCDYHLFGFQDINLEGHRSMIAGLVLYNSCAQTEVDKLNVRESLCAPHTVQ